jgi:hypothetical protein
MFLILEAHFTLIDLQTLEHHLVVDLKTVRHHFLADIANVALTFWAESSLPGSDFHQEAELSEKPVRVRFVYYLDVTSILKLLKLVSRQAHQGGPLMPIEVNKQDIRDVCNLCTEHVCRHAGLVGAVAILASPACTLFDHFLLATFVRAGKVEGLVVVS